MAIELVCGNCQGRLAAETPGSVVACPHCGAHLQVPAGDAPGPAAAGAASGETPPPPALADGNNDATLQMPPEPDGGDWGSTATVDLYEPGPESPDQFDLSDTGLPAPSEAIDPLEMEREVPSPALTGEPALAFDQGGGAPPGAAPELATAAAAEAPRRAPPGQPSPALFRAVCSYASAMTLACLYLGYLLLNSQSARLESLPDLAPPVGAGNKKVTLIYVDPQSKMPPRHTLKLGESERYGSLRLTPLKVTRGPLQFEHYDANSRLVREATEPVLKLHLRFENVSSDQEFYPLDRTLVYFRNQDRAQVDRFFANNFICPIHARGNSSERVLMYDLAVTSSWDVMGQKLDQPLSPGQVHETFLPSEEAGLARLKGDLVWRVHFRKGYNRKSHRGVTTLVEVEFDSDQISADDA